MLRSPQTRIYDPDYSVSFRRTKERFGGLSNMAPGFPIEVNEIHIKTSEALYQACRYPDKPDVQHIIISERSPMKAKMKGRRYLGVTRDDWAKVRVDVMRWCIRLKLAQNWDQFSELLLETGSAPIVEYSRRDNFWGAMPVDGRLIGTNALGRLLMELREKLKQPTKDELKTVEPPQIPVFLLYGRPIGKTSGTSSFLATRRLLH